MIREDTLNGAYKIETDKFNLLQYIYQEENMYKYILFDLDGTITDSSKGIINCVKYALDAAGVEVPAADRLFEFIGPPLTEGFMTITEMNRREAEISTAKFRERYNVTGLFENEPYEGIREVLETLSERGFIMAVATSKPEETAVRVLEHFNLAKFFREITGSSFDGSRDTKQKVIEETLKRLKIFEGQKENVLMVGDRKHDVYGAHACGIKVLGVYYGFAKSRELEEAGADYIVQNVSDIVNLEELNLSLNEHN